MSDQTLFLSHEQVCELTGARTKAGQVENLKQNGVRHTIKVNGWPCVTVAAITGTKTAADQAPKWEPRLRLKGAP